MMPSIWHTVTHRHSIDSTGLLHKMDHARNEDKISAVHALLVATGLLYMT